MTRAYIIQSSVRTKPSVSIPTNFIVLLRSKQIPDSLLIFKCFTVQVWIAAFLTIIAVSNFYGYFSAIAKSIEGDDRPSPDNVGEMAGHCPRSPECKVQRKRRTIRFLIHSRHLFCSSEGVCSHHCRSMECTDPACAIINIRTTVHGHLYAVESEFPRRIPGNSNRRTAASPITANSDR